MIKLTGITLQGKGAPVQDWDLYLNPKQIIHFHRESGKTKITMSSNILVHVSEKPADILELINETSKSDQQALPEMPVP